MIADSPLRCPSGLTELVFESSEKSKYKPDFFRWSPSVWSRPPCGRNHLPISYRRQTEGASRLPPPKRGVPNRIHRSGRRAMEKTEKSGFSWVDEVPHSGRNSFVRGHFGLQLCPGEPTEKRP